MTYLIVVGVDGSPHSDAAVQWALEEAEFRGGEVTAVFAWQVPFLSFPGAYDRDELEKAAKEFLIDKLSSIAPSPAVPLRPLVAEGDPAESLIVAAEDANMLIVGTRGRSLFPGLVLGSVSQRCAAAAHCPVLLVKASGKPAAG